MINIDTAAPIFPDDPWEYAYAANRAFNGALLARTKLASLEADDPKAATEQASLLAAKTDFAVFNAGFNEETAYEPEYRKFIVNHSAAIDPPTNFFSLLIEGRTGTTNLPEVKAILEDTKRRLSQLGSSLIVHTAVDKQAERIASGLDAVTMEYLQMSLEEVFSLYAKNPDYKQVMALARNSLTQLDLKTLKDLVALGADGAAEARNIGTRGQSLIKHIVRRYDLEDIWCQGDTATRAALLYNSLDEIPHALVSQRRINYNLTRYSVADILATDLRELARIITPAQPDKAYAQSVLDTMADFEQKFHKARLRLLRSVADS